MNIVYINVQFEYLFDRLNIFVVKYVNILCIYTALRDYADPNKHVNKLIFFVQPKQDPRA